MGTYYTRNASKQDIVDEILRDIKPTPYHPFECWDYDTQRPIKPPREITTRLNRRLDYAVKGNELWILFEVIENHDSKLADKRQVTVLLYLLEPGSDGWGYKPMDESMGPYFYKCPKTWERQLTEPPTPAAAEWRRKAFQQ